MTVIRDSSSVTSTGGCNGKASVSVSGGAAPYTYSWSPSGTTTDSITGQCAGTYCCTIYDNNGCTQITCISVTTTVGIGNIESANGEITLYPNPNKGKFTVQSLGTQNFVSKIEIYNVLGEKVYSAPTQPSPKWEGASFSYEINLSSQPGGIYFYRVLKEDGGLIGEGKFVIE
jgi:hypothetical protein